MTPGPEYHPDNVVEPVVEALTPPERAEEALLARDRDWAKRVEGLEEMLGSLRAANRDLGLHVESVTNRLDAAQRASQRQRDRAARLASAARQINDPILKADVYEMILRACLDISGATRGLYVIWRRASGTPRVRAAVEVSGYPAAPPSDFVTAACAKVIRLRDTIVSGDEDSVGLPEPGESERFRNWAVMPTFLRRDFDGVVLVADKHEGDFDEDDLEALLSVGGQATVALENAHLHCEVEQAYLTTISILADAAEAKDSYTHGHCEMASRHARLTAERLGLPDRERAITYYAALLHDVGKIGVSDGVLNKPGPLLPEELLLVRAHVRVGHDLIRNVPPLGDVATAVLHHHEWFDGSGYPDGLKGTGIPVAARVVAVVDAFGAMITRRSYKEAYPESYAREELRRFAGRQFDPEVVNAFLEVLDTAEGVQPGGIADEELSMLPALNDLRCE